MPLPNLLFVLWALWPIAAYPGGKLFAPIIVLIGLFALPGLKLRQISLPIKLALVLLFWVCLSALWSPANEGLFSGSLLKENFALEASYLRFSFTLIGCFLFVRLVLKAPREKLAGVPVWIIAGIGLHFAVVFGITVFREDLLGAQGDWMVLTGQSMGRNANLLAMAAPLLIGALALKGSGRKLLIFGGGLLVATVFFAVRLDGLAAVLALAIGGVALAILHVKKVAGFRWLFNLVAAGLVAAPALAWALGANSAALAGTLPLTAQQRILIWQATLERILERPLLGHGVNAAPTWTETYINRPDLLGQLSPELINHRIIPNHPHNMALQIWAETGLIGALMAAALLVMVGRTLAQPKDLAFGIKIAASGLFGAAISYFTVSYSVWDESFWASIAIVLSGIIVLHRKVTA